MAQDRNQAPEWAEELPPDCPPTEAKPPNNETFYRLVETIPPKEKDFYSFRRRYPDRPLKFGVCIERACSLFRTYEQCAKLKNRELHRDKKIVKIVLPPDSGLIQKTFKSKGHHSWWRAASFDPIPCCLTVEPTEE